MSSWTRIREIVSSFGKAESKARAALPLVAGLLLTGSAIFLATRRISALETDFRNRTALREIVVASGAIPSGTPLSEKNLARRSVPAAGVTRRHVAADDYELLLGAAARTPIDAGEPILYTDVEDPLDAEKLSLAVPEGYRALTLGVDSTSSFAGMLRPGDRLDFLCTADGQGGPATWIRDIAVLAAGRDFRRNASGHDVAEISTVTLSVLPAEGKALAAASRGGGLHWFLRNPVDNTHFPAAARRATREGPVEIWKGGIRVDARADVKGGAE